MKYIQKNIEPSTLKKYRETTQNASYKGFVDTNQALKKALLKEQGYICAYCMKRISLKKNKFKKPSIEVEHFLSQKERADLNLDYQNMLGVCNGFLFGVAHCDKSKAEVLLKKLNPLKPAIEKLVTYSSDGQIQSVTNNTAVRNDLEQLLKLNNQHLVDARTNTIDHARELLKKKYPIGTWTKALIDKEIVFWKSKDENGRFRPFCQIAIWFWEQQKKRNRYPAK